MSRPIFRLCAWMLLGLFIANARALTVRPPSFSDLVGSAELIVRGKISLVECELREVEGQKIPFTNVTIEVFELIKGTADDTVVLRCLGGTVGSASLRVVGAPEFTAGASGFFFIHNNGAQFCPLVGINHGCYWTVRDETTGQEIVVRDNGQPLRDVSGVSMPLGQVALSARTRMAGISADGLTPILFAEAIKAEVKRAAR